MQLAMFQGNCKDFLFSDGKLKVVVLPRTPETLSETYRTEPLQTNGNGEFNNADV